MHDRKAFVGLDGKLVHGPAHWSQTTFEHFVTGGYRLGAHAGARLQSISRHFPEVMEEIERRHRSSSSES